MPFVFLIVGIALVVTAARDKQTELFGLLKSDFYGPNSFLPWLVAMAIVGGVGYIRPLKPIANAFMLLIIIVLFLSNGGFFVKFIQQTGIKK